MRLENSRCFAGMGLGSAFKTERVFVPCYFLNRYPSFRYLCLAYENDPDSSMKHMQ